MSEASSSYYGPDAYRADAIPPLPAPPRKRERLGEDLLSFGDYAGIDPDQQEDAEFVQVEDRQDKRFYESERWWWDHQRIRFLKSQVGISIVLMAFPVLYFFFLFASPFYLSGITLQFLYDAEVNNFFATLAFLIIMGGGFIGAGIIVVYTCQPVMNGLIRFIAWLLTPFHQLVARRANHYMQNRCSAFNRQTGMVSFAQGKRKPPFEAPFIEFDGYLERVIQRGGIFYRLIFVHRYTGKSFHNTSFSSFLSHTHDVHAEWDMLQRYMDVSQPLPDIPRLEPFRHLDPTTAEHDRRTGRDPRYWRDLDLEAWKQEEKVARHRARIDYPWQQKRCQLTPQIGQVEMLDYRAQRERVPNETTAA